MRRSLFSVLFAFALMSLVACGGSGTTAPAQTGALFFRLDAGTCHGSDDFVFVIDGVTVGNQHLAAGDSSRDFTVTPGSHSAQATATVSNLTWHNGFLQVAAGQRFLWLLTCS